MRQFLAPVAGVLRVIKFDDEFCIALINLIDIHRGQSNPIWG